MFSRLPVKEDTRASIETPLCGLGALTTLHYASEGEPLSVGGIALLIAIVLAGSGGYLKSERVLLVVIY